MISRCLVIVGFVSLLGSLSLGQVDPFGQNDPFGVAAPPGAEGRLRMRVVASKDSVASGEELVLAVEFTLDPGWHTWPAGDPVTTPDLEGIWQSIPTSLKVTVEGARVGPIQWPEPHLTPTRAVSSEEVEILMYEGRQVAFVPLIVDAASQGELSVAVEFSYQACDDQVCDMPRSVKSSVGLDVVDAPIVGDPPDAALFGGFDQRVFSRQNTWNGGATPTTSSEPATKRPSFLGFEVPENAGLVVLALLSAIGGLVLNLTPCVLPVIPIKIMAISQHADTPGQNMRLGLWMAAGVIAFWAGIGLPVAFLTSVIDPSRLIFGTWWITLSIGVIIAAMGVGIMGVFNITLPQKIYMVNPKADTAQGSFMFGVMTAVLGLPCFGFVAGALLAGAATLPSTTILVIFTSLGVGMALPYIVLSAKPGLVEKIPRTGPASELVKHVMGLLLLAAAAFFVGAGIVALIQKSAGPAPELAWWWKQTHWWFVALFCVAAGGWLILRTIQITKKKSIILWMVIVGLILAAIPAIYVVGKTIKARDDFWIPYTHTLLDESVAEGKVVVVDFTAEWCLNCKALEVILNREPVKSQLLLSDVVPLIADNTVDSAPGWDKMAELGQTGIPLLVIYGPGLDKPWQANSYTAQTVLDALKQARGAPDVE